MNQTREQVKSHSIPKFRAHTSSSHEISKVQNEL